MRSYQQSPPQEKILVVANFSDKPIEYLINGEAAKLLAGHGFEEVTMSTDTQKLTVGAFQIAYVSL